MAIAPTGAPGADDGASAPAALRGAFLEIGDLKRIRSSGRDGSIARRGFRQAWAALVAGEPAATVMRRTAGAAVAAARLGDLDGPKLIELGLGRDRALAVLRQGFDEVGAALEPALSAQLRDALPVEPPGNADDLPLLPAFVRALEDQPRAGATCPGKPRLVLEPPEDHAEHCWAVAVFGVLASPAYGADPTTVFLAAMAHHFHNAAMPDSGFTGEMLLGDDLDDVYRLATERALAQLAEPLRSQVADARRCLADAETPEGRAFHAADVIDRVTQIAQHLRAASTTMGMVLDELALVHDGPVKPFHDRVLADMGLP